jgi:hypothetical protein
MRMKIKNVEKVFIGPITKKVHNLLKSAFGLPYPLSNISKTNFFRDTIKKTVHCPHCKMR